MITGILRQAVISAANAPIVHQSALLKRVSTDKFIDRNIPPKLSFFLSFGADLTEKAKVDSALIHQMLFAGRCKLRREEPCQKAQRNRIFNQEKKLTIQENKSRKAVHVLNLRHEFLILFIKQR